MFNIQDIRTKRLIILLVAILIASLYGCTTIKYVPIETTKTEYVEKVIRDTSDTYQLKHIIDSLVTDRTTHQRDCVIIVKDTAGAVINRQEYHNTTNTIRTHHKQKESDSVMFYKMKVDCLLNKSKDVVQVPAPVKRELTRWEKFKSDWFGLIVIVSLAALAVLYLMLWWQKKKNKSNI